MIESWQLGDIKSHDNKPLRSAWQKGGMSLWGIPGLRPNVDKKEKKKYLP